MSGQPPVWPEDSLEKSRELHALLSIGDRQWHQLKSRRDRRAAELLSAALARLVNNGLDQHVEELTTQAMGWLRGELKDPGCPHR